MTQFISGQSANSAHSSIQTSLRTVDKALGNTVLWFADIQTRRLYRDLGYSTMNHYARSALGFSDTKASDYCALSSKISRWPHMKTALQDGSLGYTKARMIIPVCDDQNEEHWVALACRHSRARLSQIIQDARNLARDDRRTQIRIPALTSAATDTQDSIRPDEPSEKPLAVDHPPASPAAPPPPAMIPEPPTAPAASLPIRLTLEFSPEQFALYENLLEQAHKAGCPLPSNRVDALLQLLASHLDQKKTGTSSSFPRGKRPAQTTAVQPPFQINMSLCPSCQRSTVTTSKGDKILPPATKDRALCDAHISRPGHPNKATIPPRIRREVLNRDLHRCRRPGCHNSRFLEVHHIKPRSAGGSNTPDNLITLCSCCHQLLHEKKWPTVQLVREATPPYQIRDPRHRNRNTPPANPIERIRATLPTITPANTFTSGPDPGHGPKVVWP